jgi:predicted transcriptional regulator of viral defense system
MPSNKQNAILNFARSNNCEITKKKAVELIGHHYYCSKEKYVGEVLSRMVKKGLLNRIKPGVFEINLSFTKIHTAPVVIDNQLYILE